MDEDWWGVLTVLALAGLASLALTVGLLLARTPLW